MTSDFLLLVSHGWVVTFPDSHRTVFTFRSWLDLLDVLLAFWISILKISKITSKLLTQGYRYHKLRKTFGKFFRSYSELLSKFGDISFQEYVFKGISHPGFYGDLVYKLRRVKDTPNLISSGSKIVKRLRLTFLLRCLCCHFAILTFLLVYWFVSWDWVRSLPFSPVDHHRIEFPTWPGNPIFLRIVPHR